MWLFFEFLPDLISYFKKTQRIANNPIISYIFIMFLGLVFYSLLIRPNYTYGLVLVFGFFLITISHYFITKKINSKFEVVKSKVKLNILLQPYYKVIPIKYRNMWHATELVCKLSEDTRLYIHFGIPGKEVYIKIDEVEIKTTNVSNLLAVVSSIIFQQKVTDAANNTWLVKICIGGIIKPKIIVKIKFYK